MTQYTKSALQAFFETADIPSGTDFANLIDSCINAAETSAQTMLGALNPTELITSRVSAGNANIVSTLSAATIINTSLTSTSASITIANIASAQVTALNVSNTMNITPTVVSAAGTTQATATTANRYLTLVYGVTDGSNTGIALEGNAAGRVQYVVNMTSTSANIWPASNCAINALTTNAAYGLAGNGTAIIIHKTNTSYAVK